MTIGANLPPVTNVYGIGESLETAVINIVGKAWPTTQLMVRVVPSETVSFGAGLFTDRLTGSDRSPKLATRNRTVALYVPAARVSATVVELNRKLRGAEPFTESTVSQIGRVVVSTVKNGVPEEAPMRTSALPAVPDPFTYDMAAEVGNAVNGVGASTRSVTGSTLVGAGAFNSVTVVEFVVPTAKPPQPAVATTLIDAGVVAFALRAARDVTVAQA